MLQLVPLTQKFATISRLNIRVGLIKIEEIVVQLLVCTDIVCLAIRSVSSTYYKLIKMYKLIRKLKISIIKHSILKLV